MDRRQFLQSAGALAAVTTLSTEALAKDKGRPNILVIMTDQQFADAMSCAIGKKYIDTPGMDSLAATGMRFTRAYAANPICVPSRTAMFTGRYPHETGIQTNSRNQIDVKKFPCMGTVFKQAGYETGYTGKWHLPISSKDSSLHGFDFMGYTDKDRGDFGRAKPGIDFINQKHKNPFLLVVSLMNPHNICQWARGEKLPDGPIGDPPPPDKCPPLKPNHGHPQNETDIISLMRKSYHASSMFPVSGFDGDKWRQFSWAYYRMIEMVDAEIAKVLDALRRSGQEDNTLVVFLSDHGDCHGAHRWNQKTVFYDESARVPLIVSYKGVTQTGISDRLVQTGIDLIPTLCDYAGIDRPDALPGISLKNIANGRKSRDKRQYIVVSNKLAQGAPVDGVNPAPDGRMIRSDRFKYCLYDQGKRRESLVDMQNDPGEMTNQAENPAFAKELTRHRGYLSKHAKKTGDGLALTMLEGVG